MEAPTQLAQFSLWKAVTVGQRGSSENTVGEIACVRLLLIVSIYEMEGVVLMKCIF